MVKKTKSGAPPVSYSPRDPPRELARLGSNEYVDLIKLAGYVSFPIFAAHVATEERRKRTLLLLCGFHTYLGYHIKATKMYMHISMRKRVRQSLEMLEDAKPKDPNKARKTAQGKTFRRF